MLMSKCSQVAAAVNVQHVGFKLNTALGFCPALLLFTQEVFAADGSLTLRLKINSWRC